MSSVAATEEDAKPSVGTQTYPPDRVATISDPPLAGQRIDHNGKTYTTIQEGLAYILVPPGAPLLTDPKAAKNGPLESQNVFYNPIQQYNRDLTVLAIRAFGEEYAADRQLELDKKNKHRQAKRRSKAQKVAQANVEKATMDDAVQDGEATQPATARGNGLKRKADEIQSSAEVREQENGSKRTKVGDEVVEDDIADEDLLACESFDNPTQVGVTPQNGTVAAQTDQEQEPTKERPPPKARFEILDALSATGLRALRYAHELPFVTSVTANDLSPDAVASIKLNIAHNKLEGKIKTNVGNANAHMYGSIAQEARGGPGNQYAVIDLDPYGTAVPFLDAALQAIANGGLLCVTCTDSAVFNSGGYLEKTFALYGGLPVKGDHCHEGGIRLILHAIATAGAKYGLAVEPLLSLSIDYYARVFVRVRKQPADVKFVASKTMVVYACDGGCGAWTTQHLAKASRQEPKGKNADILFKHGYIQAPTASPNCEHCGFKTHLQGPMYGGPLHNPAFVERILSFLPDLDRATYPTIDRVEGMLSTVLEETEFYQKPIDPSSKNAQPQSKLKDQPSERNSLKIPRMDPTIIDHHPFYIVPSALSRLFHCQAPSLAQLRGALKYLGYKTSRTHAKGGSIKTDAPWTALWKIMWFWANDHAKIGKVKEGMPGLRLIQKFEGLQNKVEGGDAQSSTTEETATETSDKPKPWVVFDEKLGADKPAKKLVRWQQNPRANVSPAECNCVTFVANSSDSGVRWREPSRKEMNADDSAVTSSPVQETGSVECNCNANMGLDILL